MLVKIGAGTFRRVVPVLVAAGLSGCGFGSGSGNKGGSTVAGSTATTTPGSTTTPVASAATTGTLTFKVAASMAAPRAHHTATLLRDGRVLIAGGLDATAAGAALVATPEVYDPVANAFTKLSAIEGRYLHVAALMGDGRVLIAGGYGAKGELATALAFDPATNKFSSVGSLSVARRSARAVTLADGRVLVAGGDDGKGSVTAAEIFDPAKNAFTAAGNLTTAREGFGGALVDGKALLVGGLAVLPAGGFYAAGAETFGGTSFTTVAAPANDRIDATLDVIGSDALLAGGVGANGDVLAVERFSKGSWSKLATLGAGRRHHGSAASSDRLLLAGGVANNTADLIDLAGNVTTARMAHARNGCSVTLLATGSFLVVGGFEGGTNPLGIDGVSVAPAELGAFVAAAPPATTPPATTPPTTTPPTTTPPTTTPPTTTPPTTTPPATPTLTYSKDGAPIFQANCVVCHNGKIEVSLQTYSDVMKFVVAGNPDASQLCKKTTTGTMKNYLSASEAQALRDWVKQGAKP